MAGRAELAVALGRAVDGRLVHVGRGRRLERRAQPEHGERRVELLGPRVSELLARAVPAAALEEQAADVSAVLWRRPHLRHGARGEHVRVQRELVDGDAVFSRVVLANPRDERLRRKEARDPEHARRRAGLDPRAEKGEAPLQVVHPRAECLARRVGRLRPRCRNPACLQRLDGPLRLQAHHGQAEDRLAHRAQPIPDGGEQLIVPRELVRKHHVHRLVVRRRQIGAHGLEVEELRVETTLDRLCEGEHAARSARARRGGRGRPRARDACDRSLQLGAR
mmetsp:Transcript_19791/g.50340  ORF Transcript_19791/g.50340 Transcript_19791/m.50340 type:complete len:279 (-) Transcript_19791:323-1159(-)